MVVSRRRDGAGGAGRFSIWAIPLVMQYRNLPAATETGLHGEAVAAGMVMAAQLSVAAGDMSAEELQRTETLIEACGLPTRPPADMTSEDFLQLMVRDKKVLDGQLRLVLLKGIGHGFVGADFDMNLLQQILADACSD